MKKIFLIGLLLLGLIGCAANTPIETGVLTTPGITIKAIDGSFTIKSNEVFKTPFVIKEWPGRTHCSDGSSYSRYTLIESYVWDLEHGAKKVKINFDDGQSSLFGVIQFCDRLNDYVKHYTRSNQHTLQIPTKYINQARSGRISVVYQRIGHWSGVGDTVGWKLWLSNKPF